jgi:16S rRNA (cytosine1402-N4)-methyltransferase
MHIPVMFDEVMQALQPRSGGRYLDCTLGGGGHTEGLLKASAPLGCVLATDADAEAIHRVGAKHFDFQAPDEAQVEMLRPYKDRLMLRQCWLDETPALVRELGFAPLDGILMDLGLSSFQLDEGRRGFAFMREGPLDMRFDQSKGVTAARWIDMHDVSELAEVLRDYGDVPNARRVAEAIWQARPVTTTAQLRDVVAGVTRTRSTKIHPATLVFQALRIVVNDELRRLQTALPELIGLLKPGGRLAVITFHSLEDRIVKDVFRRESRTVRAQPGFGDQQEIFEARVRLVNKEPITPTDAEVKANPRARSAKLRVAERVGD